MVTPIRVAVVAIILGVATAYLVSLQGPPLPSQESLNPPADFSQPSQLSQPPSSSLVQGPTTQPAFKLAAGAVTKTQSGLTIIDIAGGSGPQAKPGDTVSFHYIGRLYDTGAEFDNSYNRGRPLEMVLQVGPGGGIPGFIEGIIGMKAGGKRELVIPGDLGYGAAGRPSAHIPPNATLVFDVQLLSVHPGSGAPGSGG